MMLPLKGRSNKSTDTYAPSPYKVTSSSRLRLIACKRFSRFNRLHIFASQTEPTYGPSKSAIKKFDSTTAWYFVACMHFRPLYATSSPSVGLRILNNFPSTKPQHEGIRHPLFASACASRGARWPTLPIAALVLRRDRCDIATHCGAQIGH
eukprot:scaffold244_cov372-Pavlova_lutheri.AAC.10